MFAQRLFRSVIPIMLAALVYPAAICAQPNETPPGTPAQQFKGRVAVIFLEAPAEWRAKVHPGVDEGLATSGVKGMGYSEVTKALVQEPELLNCLKKWCLTRAGELLKVERFIKVQVTGAGISLKITVELWDMEHKLKTVTSNCDPCSDRQLGSAVRQGIVEVFMPPAKVPVQITSDPSKATLTIDDMEAGQTPFTGKLDPGSHTIQAALENFVPERSKIEVKEEAVVGKNKVQTFPIVLAPLPAGPPPPRRPFILLKWLGMGAAVGALGTGGYWLYIDGRGTCAVFSDKVCPEIYNTDTQGWAVLGGGVALSVATALMFLSDNKTGARYRREKAALIPTLVPTPGGAVARFQLDF